MAVLKILFLLAALQVAHPKPFLFKEVNYKKNFEFSLKPVLKPITLIQEWTPFVPVKIKHAVAKRSPSPSPPVNPEPSPAPLFKINLEKSLEIKSPGPPPPPPHPNKEGEINKQPPLNVIPPPGHPKIHEEIHVGHIHDIPKPPPAVHLLTRVNVSPSPVLPPESNEEHLPPHVRLPSVSPIPPPHMGPSAPPPLGPNFPQGAAGNEHHLLVEPKPKLIKRPEIAHEGPVFENSKSSSLVIRGHPPPPPPPHLDEIIPTPPGNGNQGTLEAFFGPNPVRIEEKPVRPSVPPQRTPSLPHGATGQGSLPVYARPPPAGIQENIVPPYHPPVLPREITGQGSLPVPDIARPPPAGIQESNKAPRSSLLTDISRADEISAYLKAIDALPLVKPPLEENVLLLVPSNSVEPASPRNTTDNTSALARGSRLALYFGNILLQVMSQAIGSARSAIGQYSMPQVF